MAILTITSGTITENDLLEAPETVRVYSAAIGNKKLSDKWIVPDTADDATEQANFRSHLTAQGFLFE